MMRVVSLLPSLTEIVCALGRGDDLVGVSHECDHPAFVSSLPRLTSSRIDPNATSSEIDAKVAEQGGSLYDLDRDRLAALRPDLILTQSQCDVCAVNEASVRDIAADLPGRPRVESVHPTDLAGVLDVFHRVGQWLGAETEADQLIGRLESTAREIASRRDGRSVPRVVLLEWTDPPFSSGHWNPELVAMAGGREMIARTGQASRRISWEDVIEASPDVLIVSPCGFSIERSMAEVDSLAERPGWSRIPAVRSGFVTVVDGSSYFSRPGPRLEESLRIAASAIDPETCDDLAPPTGWRRLSLMA